MGKASIRTLMVIVLMESTKMESATDLEHSNGILDRFIYTPI